MSRYLVVTHSAAERDAVLWKAVLREYPHVDLVVPVLKSRPTDTSWITPFSSERRAFQLPAVEPVGRGHSSLWVAGLSRLLNSGRYSLLHAAMEPWSLIPQRFVKRIPTVVQGAESIVNGAPFRLRLRRMGLKRVLKNLAGLSAWGQTSVDAFIQAGLPTSTPRAVIPMGIPDPTVFYRTVVPTIDAGLNLLYVGRLDPEKGVKTIIQALEALPTGTQCHLKLLGTGPQEQELKTYAKNVAGVQIDFVGHASLEKVRAAMEWSHVVIVPSLGTDRWMEQWGRVTVEAIYSGRPCLVSDSGELPLVSPVPTSVFRAGDSLDLASRLSDLTTSLDHMQRVADAQYESALRFDASLLAAKLNELWDQSLQLR